MAYQLVSITAEVIKHPITPIINLCIIASVSKWNEGEAIIQREK